MKKLLVLTAILVLCLAFSQAFAQTLVVYASKGNLNDIINADTLANGNRKHDVYSLVSLDTTYKFSGTITSRKSLSIIGVVQASSKRPPCIQPKVLEDGTIPPTIITLNGKGTKCTLKNLYLLALATNNVANNDGTAIQVSADNVTLVVDFCVFDNWLAFGIGYNANWDDFFITNCQFRNLVHPNQHYIGEVIRNEWPGAAYTDTMSFKSNTMLCINGYAAAPVTKYYTKYFEFIDNKVLYTFKNPFFIFNVTNAKINNNIFYANYSGGVDQTENPWWDNLWSPDVTYGLIALDSLNLANAKMFLPADSTKPNIRSLAEAKRTVEVKNNTYFWPKAITDFWTNWNKTQTNKIIIPTWMNTRTTAMFANKTTWPLLTASGNVNADPGYMGSIDPHVLNGTTGNDIGLLAYFTQIRLISAATDVWGYAITEVSDAANWKPRWPISESAFVPATGVAKGKSASQPESFTMSNYPNPFNPTTNIQFDLSVSGRVNLMVYDLNGRLVKTVLKDEYKTAGSHKIAVDMNNMPSGVYVTVLHQGQQKITGKMMLMK